jgi:hypothetical protein
LTVAVRPLSPLGSSRRWTPAARDADRAKHPYGPARGPPALGDLLSDARPGRRLAALARGARRQRAGSRRRHRAAARAAPARGALRGHSATPGAGTRARRRPRRPRPADRRRRPRRRAREARRLPRRQPLYDLGLQVRALRGGREAAPPRLARPASCRSSPTAGRRSPPPTRCPRRRPHRASWSSPCRRRSPRR